MLCYYLDNFSKRVLASCSVSSRIQKWGFRGRYPSHILNGKCLGFDPFIPLPSNENLHVFDLILI
jgi:hypothetical protein